VPIRRGGLSARLVRARVESGLRAVSSFATISSAECLLRGMVSLLQIGNAKFTLGSRAALHRSLGANRRDGSISAEVRYLHQVCKTSLNGHRQRPWLLQQPRRIEAPPNVVAGLACQIAVKLWRLRRRQAHDRVSDVDHAANKQDEGSDGSRDREDMQSGFPPMKLH
jgi:hypothetical protein